MRALGTFTEDSQSRSEEHSIDSLLPLFERFERSLMECPNSSSHEPLVFPNTEQNVLPSRYENQLLFATCTKIRGREIAQLSSAFS